MGEKQTPLIESLERVPQDARVAVEHDQFSSSSHPVGRLCHEAAAELRRLHAQAAQDEALLRQALEVLLEDRNALYECHSVPGQRGVPVDDEAVPALLRYDDLINSICNRLGGSA